MVVNPYDLNNFVRCEPGGELAEQGWHGVLAESAWSGLVVRIAPDGQSVVVGRIY